VPQYTLFYVFLGALLLIVALRLVRRFVIAGRGVSEACLAQDLSGRVIIVTGANDGLGRETVRVLAKMGARIVLACRDQEKAATAIDELCSSSGEIRPSQLQYIHLDLADLTTVRSFVEEFRRTNDRLDVLVNNAGVGVVSSLGLTKDGVEAVFQINHLGHFYLVYLLLDLIVSCDARVVNVSSFGHKLCTTPQHLDDLQSELGGARARYVLYSRSKLANVLFTRELQRRLKLRHPHFQGDVFSLSPGRVLTKVWGKMYPRWLWPFFFVLGKLTMKTPAEGAATIVFCAISPTLAGKGGTYLANCRITDPSELAQDDVLAVELWRRSEELLEIEGAFLAETDASPVEAIRGGPLANG
jgi:NAD(P)-dependent dehydrogenase (short-subunit alcohol dehydrogenase family)